jgi:hypothetical protein
LLLIVVRLGDRQTRTLWERERSWTEWRNASEGIRLEDAPNFFLGELRRRK